MNMSPLLSALEKKKYQLSEVPGTNIVILKKKRVERYFIQGYSPLVPYNLGLILSNKQIVKNILLDAKIPTVRGISCPPDQPQRLLERIAAEKLSYPLMLRQENSQLDIPAEGPIDSEEHLLKSYQKLSQAHQQIMVEPFLGGTELRVFLSADGYVNVLEPQHATSVPNILNLGEESSERLWKDVTQNADKSLKSLATKILAVFQPLPYVSFRLLLTAEGPVVLEVYHSVTPHLSFSARKEKKSQPVIDIMVAEIEKLFIDASN